MNNKVIVLFSAFSFMLFSSCDNDRGDSYEEQIVLSNVNTTAFSATVTSGCFTDLSVNDLLSGTCGLLLTDNNNDAETIFDSWLSGNDNPSSCIIINKSKKQSDGTVTVTALELSPETSYSYCLFFKSKNGKTRKLGGSGSFKTTKFDPDISLCEVKNIRYFDATLAGVIKGVTDDLALCDVGIILADNQDNLILDNKVNKKDADEGSSFDLMFKDLHPDTKYFCRIFVYPRHIGKAYYGDINAITTKSLEEMAVDLGLSVKWANCDLGEQEFSLDGGDLYIWGYTSPSPKGITLQEYKFWDSESESYIDIGQEISGTQYDPVHVQYGGKWRMPTKADVEELLECSMSKHFDKENENLLLSFTVSGKNGNSIEFKGNTGYLTGTLAFTDNSLSNNNLLPLILMDNNLVLPPSLTTRGTRIGRYHVRPVWDPSI